MGPEVTVGARHHARWAPGRSGWALLNAGGVARAGEDDGGFLWGNGGKQAVENYS